MESLGSMEIIKLSKLPSESSYKKEMISINATRWLDLSSLNESNYQKKDVLIPAGLTTLQNFLPTAFTRTHLLTHSLTHSLTHLLTHSLTHVSGWHMSAIVICSRLRYLEFWLFLPFGEWLI